MSASAIDIVIPAKFDLGAAQTWECRAAIARVLDIKPVTWGGLFEAGSAARLTRRSIHQN